MRSSLSIDKQQADSHPINIRMMLFVYICYFLCVFKLLIISIIIYSDLFWKYVPETFFDLHKWMKSWSANSAYFMLFNRLWIWCCTEHMLESHFHWLLYIPETDYQAVNWRALRWLAGDSCYWIGLLCSDGLLLK